MTDDQAAKADRIAGIALRRARMADALTNVRLLCEAAELDAYEAGIAEGAAIERDNIYQVIAPSVLLLLASRKSIPYDVRTALTRLADLLEES